MGEEVRLTWHQVLAAAQVGVQRNVENMAAGRYGSRGQDPGRLWDANIGGAIAELALATYLDRPWVPRPLAERKAGDVGRLEVRYTPDPFGDLVIYETDVASRPVWLLTGRVPVFSVEGWAWAREARELGVWRERRAGGGAWFIPKAKLHRPDNPAGMS